MKIPELNILSLECIWIYLVFTSVSCIGQIKSRSQLPENEVEF